MVCVSLQNGTKCFIIIREIFVGEECMPRISILTSTYNRAGKLPRLYQSLKKSTFKDFEWVIMNDGSSDHTEEIVKEFQAENLFPIRYYYQENAGKHVAFNRLYELAEGEYCFPMDDDDEIVSDAMEKGLAIWDHMKLERKSNCWCVCGLCVNQRTGKVVGNYFDEQINELSGRKFKKALENAHGEHCGLQKVEIVRKYKFPEIEGCSYFPEGNIWRRINKDYRQYYVNEVFRIYHQYEGESLINYSKNIASYERRYRIYKYLLSKENNYKSTFFSRRHIAEIYKYRLYADKLSLNNCEVYEGMAIENRLLLKMVTIPCRLLQKMKHD